MLRVATRRCNLRPNFGSKAVRGKHGGSSIPYDRLRVGVPKEIWQNEKRFKHLFTVLRFGKFYKNDFFRVALVPASVELLAKNGMNVTVEQDAGSGAKFRDHDYEIAGAQIKPKQDIFQSGTN